jgi:hypothetical protein
LRIVAAASISTFSLSTGIAFDSKAGSGMCVPSRITTLQYADDARYTPTHEHSAAQSQTLTNVPQVTREKPSRSLPQIHREIEQSPAQREPREICCMQILES